MSNSEPCNCHQALRLQSQLERAKALLRAVHGRMHNAGPAEVYLPTGLRERIIRFLEDQR